MKNDYYYFGWEPNVCRSSQGVAASVLSAQIKHSLLIGPTNRYNIPAQSIPIISLSILPKEGVGGLIPKPK